MAINQHNELPENYCWSKCKSCLRSPTVEKHEIHQNEYQTVLIIVKQQTNSIMFDEVK